jgi:twitching motility protein PilT
MDLEHYVSLAAGAGASDLHLEAGLPPALRLRGTLKIAGDPVSAEDLLGMAQALIGEENWPGFLERHSFDLSRVLAGVRCRINVLRTARGIGFAIRLLAKFQATLERLNLHPDLARLVKIPNGLILVSGATGSGKSSTLAALIQEINQGEARHILTIESPIEYVLPPQRAYIRQREVGRDTPSFEQGLLDALREDPDVLMVGEMRDPETMRLTLNAAETGHLVMATVHSSTCVEALQRVVAAFPAEIQNAVAAQLADCLVGVIAQRLNYRPDLKLRIPECEILVPNHAVKAHIRSRDFFKITSVMETGAEQGMWTFPRYRSWLERRTQWFIPESAKGEGGDAGLNAPEAEPAGRAVKPGAKLRTLPPPVISTGGRLEIKPVEGGLGKILKKLEGT